MSSGGQKIKDTSYTVNFTIFTQILFVKKKLTAYKKTCS